MIDKEIEDYSEPIRLDRYLRILNPDLTQGIIEKYLRNSVIKVNNKKAKSSLRISNGDILTFPENLQNDQEKPVSKGAKTLADKLLTEYLLYDHPSFYAFCKPAGLASQGGSKISVSLDEAFNFLDLRLVHRLDKDTSGIILAAKTRDDSVILTKAFADHKIHKTYFAYVKGVPEKPTGKITSYIIKKDKFTLESYPKPVKDSQQAITEYEIVKANPFYSLIKFTPQTGRMHQLRLHAKDLGCPIIGDKKYGGAENKFLMLHAYQIILDSSLFGQEIIIKAELPEYFNAVQT